MLPGFRSVFACALIGLTAVMGSVHVEAAAPMLRLEITPEWQGKALQRGDALGQDGRTIHRLDLLLSKLALQRADGSWLESRDWFAHVSLEKGKLRAQADGLPPEKLKGLRFEVGVPPEINAASPSQWPVDHPLHPDVCGLHWGWQGGYIFMALEGHWPMPQGQTGGFSFHLARDANVTRVELPLDVQGGRPMTLKLALDLAQVWGDIDLIKDGESTHSRAGDPLAEKLKTGLAKAFRVVATEPDLFQPPVPATSLAPRPKGTRARSLQITERFPQVALPADNPLTEEGVSLGERLFHDPRLSIHNRQSCASCHLATAAFTEPRAVSVGAEGQLGRRNAMPLFNLAWASNFFWDGRAKTLREQVLMPIQDPHEMNETLEKVVQKLARPQAGAEGSTDLSPAFAKAFGSPEITRDRLARALEQYLLTLISQDARFDRAVRKVGTLSEQEKRGLQLFVTEHDPKRGLFGADCFHCHGGTLFTDHQFHDNGLALMNSDTGREAVTGRAEDRHHFKTPSLRNIAVTAPYMHDGRFQTLEQVIEHYSGPLPKRETLDPNLAKHPAAGIQLSEADKAALVAFLKTLTDTSLPAAAESAEAPPVSVSSATSAR